MSDSNQTKTFPHLNFTTRDSQLLMTIFKLLWRERSTIITIVFIATLLSGIYSFIMPQTFTSTVSILPPQTEERGSGLAELLSGTTPLFDLSATLGFGGRSTDIFVDILKSRTVAETLIVRNHLLDFFGYSKNSPVGLALEPLQSATTIESLKDGLITISVIVRTSYFASSREVDTIKQKAADIANGYVRALDEVNRAKMISRAKNSRQYIEQQIRVTRVDLDSAYNRLVAFQNKNKLLSLDKQLDGMIRSAAEIKARLVEADIELGLNQSDLKQSSRLLREAQARTDEIQKQYEKLLYGDEARPLDYSVALNKLPDVGRDLANIIREVKILEEVNVYLNRQYYKEKVQEARDLPTIQVLDPAVPAYQRTSPRRLLWLLITFFIGFVVACSLIVVREVIVQKKKSSVDTSSHD